MKTVVKLEKSKIDKIAKSLDDNKVVVIKNFYNKKLCKLIVNHLKSIASGSMTSYHPIKINSPNFYRVNFDDKRSYVKGFFHQFSYFPWNQDQLNLFNIFEDAFILKNRINKIEDKRFFNPVDNSDYLIQDLGNIGTGIRPMFFTLPEIIGASSGYTLYDYYFPDPSKMKLFDTKSS